MRKINIESIEVTDTKSVEEKTAAAISIMSQMKKHINFPCIYHGDGTGVTGGNHFSVDGASRSDFYFDTPNSSSTYMIFRFTQGSQSTYNCAKSIYPVPKGGKYVYTLEIEVDDDIFSYSNETGGAYGACTQQVIIVNNPKVAQCFSYNPLWFDENTGVWRYDEAYMGYTTFGRQYAKLISVNIDKVKYPQKATIIPYVNGDGEICDGYYCIDTPPPYGLYANGKWVRKNEIILNGEHYLRIMGKEQLWKKITWE